MIVVQVNLVLAHWCRSRALALPGEDGSSRDTNGNTSHGREEGEEGPAAKKMRPDDQD